MLFSLHPSSQVAHIGAHLPIEKGVSIYTSIMIVTTIMAHITCYLTSYSLLFFLLLLSTFQVSVAEDSVLVSGQAITERYFDCCKPDCSWPARAPFSQPVQTCDRNNEPLSKFNGGSSCGYGLAYPCYDQVPWAFNDTFSYGFAGVYLMKKLRDAWCCACYEITFTSGDVKGKKMVVQTHNSGFDLLTANRFALAVCQTWPHIFCDALLCSAFVIMLITLDSGRKYQLRKRLRKTIRPSRLHIWFR